MENKPKLSERVREHSLRKPNSKMAICMQLAPRLSELLETCVQCTDISLYPARGYWRQTKADVMQFTGSIRNGDGLWTIGCWESVSDCLRFGFDIQDSRRDAKAYANIEISAKARATDRKARFSDGQ